MCPLNHSFLAGPFFYFGFRKLDALWGPSSSLATALKKTATGQFTLFPVYLSTFYMYMALLVSAVSAVGCCDACSLISSG